MVETKEAIGDAYALAVFQALRQLQQAADVHSKRLSRYGGLTPLQQLVLRVLAVETSITASQLAGFVSLSPASLSGVLERLESRGMLSRRRDAQDRRRQWLHLEEPGRQALADAPELLPGHVLKRFAALAEWERHAILATLLRAAELFHAPEWLAEEYEASAG